MGFPLRVPGPSWLTRLDTRRVPAVIDRGMAPFSAITHRDAHGADWAQAVDFTVVVTLRCDVQPLQLVAATRTRRRPVARHDRNPQRHWHPIPRSRGP